MHCNCGNNQEMVRRQHELRIYLECTACGRIHWTDKMAESAKKPKVQDSPENVPAVNASEIARAALAAARQSILKG